MAHIGSSVEIPAEGIVNSAQLNGRTRQAKCLANHVRYRYQHIVHSTFVLIACEIACHTCNDGHVGCWSTLWWHLTEHFLSVMSGTMQRLTNFALLTKLCHDSQAASVNLSQIN